MSTSPLPSILVVDDQETVLQTVRMLLQSSGAVGTILEATGGKQAIEIASQQNPEIILMDIMMPHMNGFEAAKQILLARPQTKVIIFSARRDREALTLALEIGAVGYLFKPCKHDVMGQVIRDVAAGKHAYPEVETEYS